MFFLRFIPGSNIYIFALFVNAGLKNFCQGERFFLAALSDFAKKKLLQLFMQLFTIS